MVNIFWLVVGGGRYIFPGGRWWWMVVGGDRYILAGVGLWWLMVGPGGWWHSLV